MNLEKLFNPKSIAIVGASSEDGKIGNAIAKNILELGYQGEIFLVNPKYDELFGKKCFRQLADIGQEVDLAIIAIPAKLILAEIRANAEKIKSYVVISAGFSENGEEGRAREIELKKIAEEKNLTILGPNCLGFIIPELKLNASFASGIPAAGNVAFVTQSGALAVALMDLARKENMRFSNIISVGNKMIVSETELLEYLAKDEKTKVIGMYLEGIKNGTEFMRVAAEVSKIKPIVVLKAGKTEKAQKAISSHTGALAGSDEIMEEVFKKCGVLRADNLEEFFELINFISFGAGEGGQKVVVITNAGGPGVLTTDAFRNKKIELAELSEVTKKKLRKILPAEASVENPIDLLGDAKQDRYKKVLSIIDKEKEISSIICILTPQDQTPVARIINTIIKFKAQTKKILVTSFIGGERIEKGIKKLKAQNIFNFMFPEAAVKVLNHYYEWNQRRQKNKTNFLVNINNYRKEKIGRIISKAKGEGRGALYFSEAKELMEMYGIVAPKNFDINFGEKPDEKITFPVVLKVDSDKVLHKTDKKALVLSIKSREELEKAIGELRENFPTERLIVQPMLEKGVEVIMGVKYDAVFGPVLVYGLGGIYTEIFKMVNFLVLPLDMAEIESALKESKIRFLFQETRGQKAYNISELARIILALTDLALELENNLSEIDINPLLVYNNGSSAVAVDIKVII